MFTIICFLNNFDQDPVFEQLGDLKLYVIGFLFGLLTLPFPGWFFHFFQIHVAKIQKDPNAVKNDGETTADDEEQVVLNDPYMYLKLIFLLATGIVYSLVMVVLFCLVIYARTDNSKMDNLHVAAYLETFKMTDA